MRRLVCCVLSVLSLSAVVPSKNIWSAAGAPPTALNPSSTRSKALRGFTLIELLIVVLIIAILAAIALPNFLEFQMRAKVSRVKADIRTVALAMEVYATEYSAYPYVDPQEDHAYLTDIPVLTTPIAYLTSLPKDVFPPAKPSEPREKYYRYYPVEYWREHYPDLRLRNWAWIVMSNGPDLKVDVTRENAQDAIDGNYYMVYDPTNGTLSPGDIWATNLGIMGGVHGR
jgi:prepilin-type N-terminal cleavage/methylation domain-containing protein